MKRGMVIFLRVIFILLVMCGVAIWGMRTYYLHESAQAIQSSLIIGNAPVIGQETAGLPIVEFFDYRCSHCYTLSGILAEAVQNDPSIKIILRPVAIGDQGSVKIGSLVLAADRQRAGASVALHQQIMALGSPPEYDAVKAMAASAGIDVEKAEKDAMSEDVRQMIRSNTRYTRDIGFYGVPALVIGDKGYMPENGLMPGINELRLMILDAKTRLNVH